MITSFFDGRVRIRAAALREPANMALVLSLIQSKEGVINVTTNPRTGSVLMLYDPEKIPRESLQEAALLLESRLGAPDSRPARKAMGCSGRLSPLSSRDESLLLAGVFALTAVTGLAGKGPHVTLAALFAVLAGVHVFDRRRRL